jgi:prepilin-type N-terminal cleavage/methylation domain-containing protein
MRPTAARARAGYTLIEIMIAMVVGVLVLSSATSLAVTSFRSMSGLQLRDAIDRTARFLGLTLQRDLAETGVDIDALPNFGTLAVWNDSVSILRVPYEPTAAPAYPLSSANFANGVCGLNCLEIRTGGPVPSLAVGDVARFQLQQQRRLLLITGIAPVANGYQITFFNTPTLIHHTAATPTGLNGGNVGLAIVQKLAIVIYWRQGTQLMRATRLNAGGSFAGEVIGDGVQSFRATLIFTDGDELPQANGTDADGTNDYNDISGIRVRAVIQSDRVDPRINGGVPLTRPYEWFVAPRNLIYERNRVAGP